MGAEARSRPPLHPSRDSPTRSLILPKDHAAATDLATDLSQRTAKSSFSIPEDGSPVIINTKRRSQSNTAVGPSQTSLLIEYFEGGKGPDPNSKPSVRVKVTPSSSRNGPDSEHQVHITEEVAENQPSYTRRISLGPRTVGGTQFIESEERHSVADHLSLSPRPRAALDIESGDSYNASEMTSTSLSNQNQYSNLNPSEISSMPPDSVLESAIEAPATPKATGSRGVTSEEVSTTRANLTAPVERSRSVSKERLTRRVIEKLGQEQALATSSGKERSGKTRSRSVSKEHLEEASSPRRRSGKHRTKDEAAGSDPSLLTASQVSEGRSIRSGASKSSINNPKLLETVEDAIRRLILPELTALKLEQKTQKNREKFESGRRESGSSVSRDELGRRLSKHSSDPSVRTKQRSLDDDDIAAIKKRAYNRVYDYPSEKGMSDETVIRDGEKPRRRRSKDTHRLRDAATGALVAGVLTREALKHHDSQSSIERRERRRKRNKSQSRSHSRNDSLPESEDAFQKHNVPPMPMRSEVTGSDLTRDSILSERTSTPTSQHRRAEIRQVARGGSMDVPSPTKPTRTRGLEESVQHEQYYDDDVPQGDDGYEKSHHYRDMAGAGLAGATAGLGAATLVNSNTTHYYDDYSQQYGAGHTLSPIQSVASLEEAAAGHPNDTQQRAHSTGSLSSHEHHQEKGIRTSAGTYSSVEDERVDRPRGFSLESPSEILEPHSFKASDPNLTRGEDGRYRGLMENDDFDDSKGNAKHLSTYTDDSMEAPYLAAQQIRGVGANPEYIQTPVAVESAVASLYEPSVLDAHSNLSGRSRAGDRAQSEPLGSDDQFDHVRYEEYERPASTSNLGSPLKNQVMHEDIEGTRDLDVDESSPRQSAASPTKDLSGVGRGYDGHVQLSHSGLPDVNDPMPAIGHFESKSDISTNPSIIQGPGGGLDKEQTPWMYDQPGDKAASGRGDSHDSLKAAAKNFLAAAAGASAGAGLANRNQKTKDVESNNLTREAPSASYTKDDAYLGPPPKAKPFSPVHRDEGYETGVPAHSPSLTPDQRGKAPTLFGGEGLDDVFGVSDPYALGQPRAFSADSHGAASPLYDSATGRGLDRIQSKDIVALMNHLTVRDAQRNARDTEILVTMVQIATELRTSFADMRKFIHDQDDMMIDVGTKQHDKTQRVISGPRPQPPSSARLPRGSSEEGGEDTPGKRRNVFRRALRNLSGKNNDMSKVEDMLNHLLEEVADLKLAQGLEHHEFQPKSAPQDGLTSYEALRDGQQSGYEPEGRAGTSSNADNSGFFSNASSQQTARPQSFGRRKTSENRISTVMEADEEGEAPLEPHEEEILNYENTEELLTPTRTNRASSNVPETPIVPAPAQGTGSNENTPRTDKSKKHSKSSSSSFFPKISRWSKTTASSVAENVRNSARRERPYSNVSHSGSDLQNYDVAETYDPQGDDRLRSNTSLNQDRPPSPLVPSSVSEKPTYRAHRDSLNLQHPQPRPGPTARYQNHLESQAMAQNPSPVSPSSDHFGSNPVLARYSGAGGNRYSGGTSRLTPISDAGQSEAAQSTQAPPRPPKIRDDGPLVPAKIPLDEKKPTFAERSAPNAEYAKASEKPRSFSGQSPPQRKPTGPRPIVSSGSYTPDRVAAQPRTRYRGSPNPIDSGSDDVTF